MNATWPPTVPPQPPLLPFPIEPPVPPAIPSPLLPPLPPSMPPPRPPAPLGGYASAHFNFELPLSEWPDWTTGLTSPENGEALGGTPYGLHRQKGSTQSPDTGPTSGHGGFGYYYYAEASAPRLPGDVFELSYDGSICDDIGHVARIAFYYHMRGEDMGRLQVVTPAGNVVWEAAGHLGVAWKFAATVDVYASSFTFRVIRGSGWHSDVAVDDVSVWWPSVSESLFICSEYNE